MSAALALPVYLAVLVVLGAVSALRSKPVIIEQNVLHKLSSPKSVLIIDGDNLRGKTKFSLTKEEVCHRLEQWVMQKNLSGRVVLVYDHASQQCSFMLNSGVAVVFSGPQCSGDDIIARDVELIRTQFNTSVIVVTDDKELRRRCSKESKRILKKRNVPSDMSQQDVHIITSSAFAEFIMTLSEESLPSNDSDPVKPSQNMTAAVEVLTSPNVKSIMSNMNTEIELRRKLSQVRALLVNTNRRQKSRMQSREKQIQERLQRVQMSRSTDAAETLKQLSAIVNSLPPSVMDSNETRDDDIFERRFEILSEVLNLFKYDRSHVEDTWERVILAEKFRDSLSKSKLDNASIQSMPYLLHSYVDALNERYSHAKAPAPFVMT